MAILKALGWVVVPFVMLFFYWKKISKFSKAFALIYTFFLLIMVLAVNDDTTDQSSKSNQKSEKPKVLTEAQKEKKRIEQYETCFSPWDGSHTKLKYFIKDNMNDPGSFDHVETTYRDLTTYLIVKTTFRGTNQFGAKVKNSVRAKVSADDKCTLLEILE